MADLDLIREVLRQIRDSVAVIGRRFTVIHDPEDFTSSEEGLEKLDAICMRLIAVGEVVKKLDKLTNGEWLDRYPEVDWRGVMGMRDVLSHQYFDLDAEIIYSVCAEHIGKLERAVQRMLDELPSEDE